MTTRRRKPSSSFQSDDQKPIVYAIDDDADVRAGLEAVLDSVRLSHRVLSSTKEFWRERIDTASCLVLDLRLIGESGLDFQKELAHAGLKIPILFLTGHGDIPVAVKAMKAGAVGFLTKPFREQDLLDAVHLALEGDRKRRSELARSQQLRARYETLTERERQVMPLVVAGLQNKQIAHELNLSEVTVKVHRGGLMRKLGARSLADLVKMSVALENSAIN